MADLQEIGDVVMKFAKQSTQFLTPGQFSDPIHPAISSLTDDAFHQFFFDLLHALTQSGITAKLPMEALRACKTWRDVAVLILHFQD